MLKSVHSYKESGAENWGYCVAFSKPSLVEYGMIEHWAYHVMGKAHIDTTWLRYGEVWFDDEYYASLFVLKWA